LPDTRLPLAGLLVVALEQAVAAPIASRKLADAGARVIKLERPEGDFARYYDHAVHGESTHFVWLNRGKESVVADLTKAADRVLFEALMAKADVLIQNLKPGAIAKLGFPLDALRARNPKLITCSISGYGEDGPYRDRKAYDLLIQAESGLSSVTGGPEAPARVGVSVVDIGSVMHAYEAILEALIARGVTGLGRAISVSMFDSMMEWMTVPLLFGEYGRPPKRQGLTHPTLAPYGVFMSRDGVPLLISIQNDREWQVLAREVLGRPEMADDPRYATVVARLENRAAVDAAVTGCFAAQEAAPLIDQLARSQIAFGRLNDVVSLLEHPQLRRTTIGSPTGPVHLPMPAARHGGSDRTFGPIPALGAHTAKVRAEFL
jgi:formyl-CoA transferase